LWKDKGGGTAAPAPLKLHHTKTFTSLAVSPSGELVAAGDASGRVLIWHDVISCVRGMQQQQQQQQKPGEGAPAAAQTPTVSVQWTPTLTTVHWHAHAIGCLTFSADGCFLYSGGLEAVLVQWQLDTSKRNYLPRLRAPLAALAFSPSDASLLAVMCSDNALRLVNLATFHEERCIYGPRPPFIRASSASLSQGVARELSWDPRSGATILSVAGCGLQWYDAQSERHVSELQVAPRNYVSQLDAASSAAPEAQVVFHAFALGGRCLVTVDRAPAGEADSLGTGTPEEALKFWVRAPGSADADGSGEAPFELGTLMHDPHKGLITAVCSHPSLPLAVTASADGEFKIWEAVRVKGEDEPGASWRCRSVASYGSAAFTAAAYSPDGSLLAVATAHSVTLWDGEGAGAHAATLHLPAGTAVGPIDRLAFVVSGRSSFLVATCAPPSSKGVATGTGLLVVWDLLTLAVFRAYHLSCLALAASGRSDAFAVLTRDGLEHAEATSGEGDAEDQNPPQPSKKQHQRARRADGGAHALLFGGPDLRLRSGWLLQPRKASGSSAGAGPALLGFNPADDALWVASGDHACITRLSQSSQGRAPNSTAGAREEELEAEAGNAFAATFGNVKMQARAPAGGAEEEGGAGAGEVAAPATVPASAAIKALFDAPSHLLPSLTTLCPAFLDALLIEGEPKA